MQLAELRMKGFRRFADEHVDLNADVVAFVGPNEAGKSSVLEALAAIEDDEPFDRGQLTDRREVDDDQVVVQLRFLLDEEEAELVREVGGVGEPRWFVVEKRRVGRRTFRAEPKVTRDVSLREDVTSRARRLLNNSRLKSWLDEPLAVSRPGDEPDDERTLRTRLSQLQDALPDGPELLNEQVRRDIGEAADLMHDRLEAVGKHDSSSVQAVVERLQELSVSEKSTPQRRLNDLLSNRRPRVLMFGDAHRYLRDEYEIQELTDDRLELRNVMDVGGTKPSEVGHLMRSGDAGRLRGKETEANARLRDAFDVAWSQSGVHPELVFGDETVRVMVPSPRTGFSPIAQRSDGLRAFVELFAFTNVYSSGPAPVLLIDEAERHLHYDAQADLVSMFYRQEAASQIIYTTHSAGCLPHDLGTGVRVVAPEAAQGEDTGRSRLHNHFWGSDAGFTPLMLAMGASALAFAPTRRALIGEGATEMFLLPSMFREVAPDGVVHFQVAPGLANVSEQKMRDLDFEAPQVAYLVDGDDAGRQIKRDLVRAGVEQTRIVELPEGVSCDDLVAADVHADAVNAELQMSGHELTLAADELPSSGRAEAVKRRCEEAGVPVPGKVAVARRVLQVRGERRITDEPHERVIRGILASVNEALGLQQVR